MAVAQRYGADLPEEYLVYGTHHPLSAEGFRVTLRLLLSLPLDQRPDGLIMANENLLNHVREMAQELSLQIGRDIDIATTQWLPRSASESVDVGSVAFDCNAMIDLGVQMINSRRAGRIEPEHRVLPVVTSSSQPSRVDRQGFASGKSIASEEIQPTDIQRCASSLRVVA